MNLLENPEELVATFLSEQLFAILSTQGDRGSHLVIVSFVVTKHLREILFITPRQTRKYENLLHNGQISLYVDNRSNDIRDLQRLTGIEIEGNATEVKEEDRGQYKEFYMAKYPYLKDFADSPTSAFIKVDVSRYEIINHFQNVSILEVK